MGGAAWMHGAVNLIPSLIGFFVYNIEIEIICWIVDTISKKRFNGRN